MMNDAAILEAYTAGEVAPNTRKQYDHGWKHWVIHATEKGFNPLKASPENLAMWLAISAARGRQDGGPMSLSSVRQRKKSVAWVYLHNDLDPIADSSIVKKTMKGITREKGTAQKQAAPLREHHLRPILKAVAKRYETPTERQTARMFRDVAILYTARNGLLRISELAQLRWEDVRWDGPHGKGGALYLPKSKADQFGEGKWMSISAETITHLQHWMMAGPQTEDFGTSGPVFVDFRTGDAMKPTRFGQIITSLCVEAFGPEHGAGFSGHSPRVGMAVDAREAGMSLQDVKIIGRWSSIELVLSYLAEYEARRDPMASLDIG